MRVPDFPPPVRSCHGSRAAPSPRPGSGRGARRYQEPPMLRLPPVDRFPFQLVEYSQRSSSCAPEFENTRAAGELVYLVLESQMDRRSAAFVFTDREGVAREPEIQ